MTTKTYAILDPHAVGPFEEIQQGGTIATCNADAQDIHRTIRGTEGFSSGLHYAEFTAFGEGDIVTATCGIMTALAPLDKYVGETAEGLGLKMGLGGVFSGDVQQVATDATAVKITVGVLLDADADTCTFLVANTVVATVSITPGQTWYFACGVGSTVAYDLAIFVQSGQSQFIYPQPDKPGWYTETGGAGIVRVCSDVGFLTASSDTPANTPFAPDLLGASDFTFGRTGNVWTMTNENYGSTFGSLALKNDKGKYDYLLDADPRNASVELRLQPIDGNFGDSFVVATAIVNTIKTDGESQIRLELADKIASIQRPLQNKKFPPWVDPGAANRPFPILDGAVRQFPPPLIDQENRVYQVNDGPVSSIGVLRGGGDPFDPLATPPDYVQTDDLSGLVMQVLPTLKLTGDFSNLGTNNQIDGADDVLADAGLFTTWTTSGNPPDGWTGGGSGTRTRKGIADTYPQDYVALLTTTDPWDPADAKFGEYLKFAGVFTPGRTYNITFKVYSAGGSIPAVIGIGYWFGIRVLSALDNAPSSSISAYNDPIRTPIWRNDDQYTLSFTCPAGATRDLYFVLSASTSTTPDTSTGTAFASFYGIRVEEVPLTAPNVPLQGKTLSAMLQGICNRLELDATTDYVLQDAIDIDTALGYDSMGYAVQDPINGDTALRDIMDSVTGLITEDHLGRIRFGYLFDPETVADVDVAMDLSELKMAYPVNCEVDEGRGLTTQAGNKKNYYIATDSDFVTDFSPLTGIDAATRERFKKESQYICTSTSPLASFYNQAKSAAPIIMLHDDIAQTQAEIDRAVALYSTPPLLYTFTVFLTAATVQAAAQLVCFRDVVKVTYKNPPDRILENGTVVSGRIRYGLDAKKALVVDTTLGPRGLYITLTVWIPNPGI